MLTPIQAHQLLLAKAKELGLPTSFRRDLEVHDFSILHLHPRQPLIWYIYPSGTHLWALADTPRWKLDFFPDVADAFEGGHFFYFTGERLHPMTLLQIVEIHAHEREASRQKAANAR